MKKLVFLFVAFVAVSLASCGNKAANNGESVDSTAVMEESVTETVDTVDTVATVDSAACDSVVAE